MSLVIPSHKLPCLLFCNFYFSLKCFFYFWNFKWSVAVDSCACCKNALTKSQKPELIKISVTAK